jgi:nucleotidyltransferase substrate binding protein (TIGR01987 family)
MMIDENNDVRWKQRFANFQKAFGQLTKFIDKAELSELEEQGLIKSFEYTFELAWTTLKDFLEYRGQSDIYGSRDAIRKAFQLNLIDDGENWMDMLASRNRTSHTYNKETAEEICRALKNVYFGLFQQFEKKLGKLKKEAGQA